MFSWRNILRVSDGLWAILLLICLNGLPALAQKTKTGPEAASLCTRNNALYSIKLQAATTKSFDNTLQRIKVLIRSADLLWAYDRETSLALFKEAFELAGQSVNETTANSGSSSGRFAPANYIPDPRYQVIAALAKRDVQEARKLSKQIQQETKEENAAAVAGVRADKQAAEGLLRIAIDLSSTDPVSAMSFARASLRYIATVQLPIFLFELSKSNKAQADQFYKEALNVYGSAPMDQFLYLSSYPFGNSREAGDMPTVTFYQISGNFRPNPDLQRFFTETLLARVQLILATPVDVSASARLSEPAQMWLALSRLTEQIQTSLPQWSAAVTQAKDKLFILLSPASQQRVTQVAGNDNRPATSFDAQVEAAEKTGNEDLRDQRLVAAVTESSKEESLEKVIAVIEKITDSEVREALSNWFYFFRAQTLIAERKVAEATNLAKMVTELDQRAYLYARIAEESITQAKDESQARELLNEISAAMKKAPKTVVTARALLLLAHLYSKIDANRGVEELGNAVNTINAIERPDFSLEYVTIKIQGKTFGSYASLLTPGFNPENAFREMGKVDFDSSLQLASALTDKPIRALTTLALMEPCLKLPAQKRQAPKNTGSDDSRNR